MKDSNPYLLRHPGFRSRLQTIPRHPPKRRAEESNLIPCDTHRLATGSQPTPRSLSWNQEERLDDRRAKRMTAPYQHRATLLENYSATARGGASVSVVSTLTGRPFGPSWRYQSPLGR